MEMLQIFLLGCMRIVDGGTAKEIKLSRKMGSLLAYLLLEAQPASPQENLASIYWPGRSQSRARACLSAMVRRLQNNLEPASASSLDYLLRICEEEAEINLRRSIWLDAAVYEDVTARVLGIPSVSVQPGDIQELETAVALYQGEFLPGCDQDWVLTERERYRMRQVNSLFLLLQYFRQRACYEQALVYGQALEQLEPWREGIQRCLMELYLICDQPVAALQQYAACARWLKDEFGVRPLAETQKLYERILAEPALRWGAGVRTAGGREANGDVDLPG